MTISREYRGGPFVAQCDTCLDTEVLAATDPIAAVNEAVTELRFKRSCVAGVTRYICRGCPA